MEKKYYELVSVDVALPTGKSKRYHTIQLGVVSSSFWYGDDAPRKGEWSSKTVTHWLREIPAQPDAEKLAIGFAEHLSLLTLSNGQWVDEYRKPYGTTPDLLTMYLNEKQKG